MSGENYVTRTGARQRMPAILSTERLTTSPQPGSRRRLRSNRARGATATSLSTVWVSSARTIWTVVCCRSIRLRRARSDMRPSTGLAAIWPNFFPPRHAIFSMATSNCQIRRRPDWNRSARRRPASAADRSPGTPARSAARRPIAGRPIVAARPSFRGQPAGLQHSSPSTRTTPPNSGFRRRLCLHSLCNRSPLAFPTLRFVDAT